MKITVDLPDDQLKLIQEFLATTAASEANTHGALAIENLAALLLEDVALMVRRPWIMGGLEHEHRVGGARLQVLAGVSVRRPMPA